ncbi:MAG: hypothetical protein U9Q12_03780 [Patescibacteria group bacterium]|nr:hypothetical protein [Patescibacteria group bacterium]
MSAINDKAMGKLISERDEEKIGQCAEMNAGNCNFKLLGRLCEHCSAFEEKDVPRNCPWVRKI